MTYDQDDVLAVDAMAIIGLAVRMPGARDVEEFWRNLVAGRESVAEVDTETLRARGVSEAQLADSAYVRAVSSLDDADCFDAAFFGMTPREAQLCDPQIRLFLEVAHTAIEDAGYDPAELADSSVGVFASAGPSRYAELYVRKHPDLTRGAAGAMVESLNHPDYVATTTSYQLNLRGPSMTILTACSSTLVALHTAAQALRLGDCDVAVVGGADLRLPYQHGYPWSPGGVRSRTGHCRPFDEAADGTVFGSGAAAVLLKRLPDAIRDRDKVTAVIQGSAVNNDGADKVSFSAPSVSGQVAVVVEAMSLAGVAPRDVSFVEAHGTGTPLGDPIEIAALTEAYRRLGGTLPSGSCPVGSVKGNVGHLGAVAGITGLIKAALALHREQLPPSANFATPNPKLGLADTPFRVADRVVPLRRDPDRPRYAGVSSLGVGGSNVHVVLAEPPAQPSAPTRQAEPRLLVWSARSEAAERAARDQLKRYFSWRGDEVYADAVSTLQHGRAQHPVRAAAVASDPRDAAAALGDDARVFTSARPVGPPRPVALLLPGQGAQRARMAAGLYRTVPAFTEAMDECAATLAELGVDAHATWLGGDGDIDDTRLAQPLLVAVEVALAQTLAAVGPTPKAVLGHSVGELAAACVAGVFGRADAMRLVVARAAAMAAAPPGGMLAVAAGADAVADLVDADVRLAVLNSPRQVVLSGSVDGLERVAATLKARGTTTKVLRTSGAFHHPMLAEASAQFEEAFAGVTLAAPTLPVYSAATGELLTDERAKDPAFWARQLTTPMNFQRAAQALLADLPEAILIEAGPGRDLYGMLRAADAVRSGAVRLLSALPRDAGDEVADRAALLDTVGKLWVDGHRVDFAAAGQQALVRRESLPGYPYQRQRHWVDLPTAAEPDPAPPAVAVATDVAATTDVAPEQPVRPAQGLDDAFSVLGWEEHTGEPAQAAKAARLALVLLPEESDRALTLLLAIQQAGYRTVRVRPGSGYAVTGEEFRVRPASAGDLDKVLAELAARGQHPDLLVHALAATWWDASTVASLPEQLDHTFYTLLTLVQRALRPGPGGRQPALVVLTTGAVDVSGDDEVQPVKAALPAAVRTLALELPWLSARTIDVSDRTTAAALRDELGRTGPELVALRGRRRWTQIERPLSLPDGAGQVLRPNGVYVLTGGLGGLGVEVAKGLAATGLRPRLALLQRQPLAEGAERNRLLAEGDERTVRAVAALADIRAMGGEARVIGCDLGDLRQTRRALDLVTGLYGPVNGVLHLAGVPGNGLLQLRGPDAAEQVLRPKVYGNAVLEQALAGRPRLDFLVHFSSRAAVDGLVGSGDYAAANAVLDLAATAGSPVAERVLSIGWPSWSRVGMAAKGLANPVVRAGAPAGQPAATQKQATPQQATPSEPPPEGTLRFETVISDADTWALDEHRLAGTGLLPGTGHLDLVLRAYQALLPQEAPCWAGGEDALTLSDVVFTAPLVAPEARRVRIDMVHAGQRRQFALLSRTEADPAEEWTRHLTGRVEREAAQARSLDLTEIRSDLETAEPPKVDGEKRMFTLGPRWRNMTSMASRDTTKVIELELAEEYHADLAVHPVHPALLDCATSAVRDAEEPFHLPFMYRRMTVFDRLPGTVTAVSRRKPSGASLIVADVDLADPQGNVLVSVSGFTMRKVESTAFAEPASTAPAPAAEPRSGQLGIAPEDGVALLLRLLGTTTPERVLVRPHVDGRPVPLATAPAPPSQPVRQPVAPPVPQPSAPSAPAESQQPPAEDDEPNADRVRAVWQQVLGVADIKADDDFFDLGGNSLTAVELMSRIRDTFGIELSIALIFDAPTLAGLTRMIEQQDQQ